MPVPAIGEPAPDFDLPTTAGPSFRVSAHRGRPVLLFFYAEDDTEGCTIENQEFSALLPDFAALGAEGDGVEDRAGPEALGERLDLDLGHDYPFTAPSERPSTR